MATTNPTPPPKGGFNNGEGITTNLTDTDAQFIAEALKSIGGGYGTITFRIEKGLVVLYVIETSLSAHPDQPDYGRRK